MSSKKSGEENSQPFTKKRSSSPNPLNNLKKFKPDLNQKELLLAPMHPMPIPPKKLIANA